MEMHITCLGKCLSKIYAFVLSPLCVSGFIVCQISSDRCLPPLFALYVFVSMSFVRMLCFCVTGSQLSKLKVGGIRGHKWHSHGRQAAFFFFFDLVVCITNRDLFISFCASFDLICVNEVYM